MEPGTRVWCHEDSGDDPWIFSEVLARAPDAVSLTHVGGDRAGQPFDRPLLPAGNAEEGARYEGVELANAPLSAADIEEGADNDMISLQHLHEPAILAAVSERYFRDEIYTWTGPVLIAVNPFIRLPLYTTDILDSYRKEGLFRSQNIGDSTAKPLGPHVYSVADRSYRQMMAVERKSQSILISGESGAGKTETTKIVLSYLTTLGQAHTEDENDPADAGDGKLSVMERVLESNPILEAFGNAKTLRNDNSSRFGKFMELGFNRAGILQGAKVQTYLLEKVRIGYHASGERNYHIFYQLLRGATPEQQKEYGFHDGLTEGVELSNYFHLTGQGGAPQLRGESDEDGLRDTIKSMRSMGWPEVKVGQVLSIVAGILHLGQVKFESKMSDGGQEIAEIADMTTVEQAAGLLGVDLDKLVTALTVRILVTRNEEMRIDLSPVKAADARDSLAKTVYGALFLWVVQAVNDCIMWENEKDVRSSSGVLDIFGFESFAINSFEQLCINYTNEALQQQFNSFIFKLEQEEYEREGIDGAFIDFADNQDCLDTIATRPKGVLAMLDDECKLGQRGSDKGWFSKLNKTYLPNKKQTVSDNTRYSATAMQQAKGTFCIRHFAGNVTYTATTNFLEKNRDEIPLTAKSLFEEDSTDLMKDIYAVQKGQSEDSSSAKAGKPTKQKTVSQQFKVQLLSLIAMIETTDPHYIRCLKPNDAAKPKLMTRKRLTLQLRYGGVLEAVRVARMGYPIRLDHDAYFQRYRMCLPSIPEAKLPWSIEEGEPQKLCVKLLDILLEEGAKPVNYANADGSFSRLNKIRMTQRQPEPMVFPRTDMQLGLTKVFMRKGPHEKLESHRVFHQNAAITLIQSWMRGLQQERRHLIGGSAALNIERWYRGCLGRARWWRLREIQASLLLTNTFRMQINRRKYNRSRVGTMRVQAQYRGRTVRKINAATRIQSNRRMYTSKTAYRNLKSATIAVQCCARRDAAKRVFDEIKRAQKDMGKVKEHNEQLKTEMASLKAMLQAQAASKSGKAESQQAVAEKQKEIDALEARIASLEADLTQEKENVKKMENGLNAQKENNRRISQDLQYQKNLVSQEGPPQSPLHARRQSKVVSSTADFAPARSKSAFSADSAPVSAVQLVDAVVVGHSITPEALAQHRGEVAKLEEQLENERRMGRVARNEVKKLRASIAGGSEIMESVSEVSESEMDNGDEAGVRPSVSDYFPMIKRGFEEDAVPEAVSDRRKQDFASRKEREECLRDEARLFETKVKKFYPLLEEGVDVTMWQFNKNAEAGRGEAFAVKSSSLTLKLHRRGDLLVQTVLTFNSTGGYLSKALGRRSTKAAHEPLPLNDILEVKAGCVGFDHAQLPSASSKKGKSSKVKSENMQSSLFLTIKATPTPMAPSRSYILRLKSRSTRNDILAGLRGILADLQVHEGISISHIQTSAAAQGRRMPGASHKNAGPNPFLSTNSNIMVPLGEVHDLVNRERHGYDRLFLIMLQGSQDLNEKEEELTLVRGKVHQTVSECAEKDKTQANDSKLIMQLSKKLETLLMENEDLRDNNDRLNGRLIEAESEKINRKR